MAISLWGGMAILIFWKMAYESRPLGVLEKVKVFTKFLSIMSFQAYIDNIKAKTGKSPEDFKQMAEEKGFLENGALVKTVKATEITNWLKEEFELGHGHAMAIYASFKGKTE